MVEEVKQVNQDLEVDNKEGVRNDKDTLENPELMPETKKNISKEENEPSSNLIKSGENEESAPIIETKVEEPKLEVDKSEEPQKSNDKEEKEKEIEQIVNLIEDMEKLKKEGNSFTINKNYPSAEIQYTKALNRLDSIFPDYQDNIKNHPIVNKYPEEKQKLDVVLKFVYSNLSNTLSKLGRHQESIKYDTKVNKFINGRLLKILMKDLIKVTLGF